MTTKETVRRIYPRSGGIAPTTAPTHVFTGWICFNGVYTNAYRIKLEAARPAANAWACNNLVIRALPLVPPKICMIQVFSVKWYLKKVPFFVTSLANIAVPAKPMKDAQVAAWDIVMRPEGSGLSIVLFILASFSFSNTLRHHKSSFNKDLK